MGGYMSPVANAYGKAGLLPGPQRIHMCQLAAASSSSVMVEPWEGSQPVYTPTLPVRSQIGIPWEGSFHQHTPYEQS